jgi:hypothetical protein
MNNPSLPLLKELTSLRQIELALAKKQQEILVAKNKAAALDVLLSLRVFLDSTKPSSGQK